MGLFSKKKTSTTTTVEQATATKVVKLTYIQSVLVNGGAVGESQFAGVTSASTTDLNSANKEDRDTLQKIGDTLKNPLSALIGLGTPYLGGVISSLFGKKVSTQVNVNVKESGWSVVKSWAQPEFDVIRYAIGIKDLSVSQYVYDTTSEMVSKPWSSPKEISKVNLLVDQFIPPSFPTGSFIEYYVKPDFEDADWIRINPMELPSVYDSSGAIVPRIISFNTERPISANLENAYITTPKPVKAVRLRVVLRRPSNSLDSYTPVLRSYRLLLTPRGGL